MEAILFIVGSLWSLYLGIFVLRFVMQLVRANFRNPAADAIVKLTNPLLLPLRRVLPPIGKVDTATIVSILLLAAGKIAVLRLIAGIPMPSPLGWLYLLTIEVVVLMLWVLFWCIFLSALISFLTQGARTIVTELLESISEPVLRPFRRYIPSFVAGFDLSYLWALIAIQAVIILITTSFKLNF
jgi:YggT family protein